MDNDDDFHNLRESMSEISDQEIYEVLNANPGLKNKFYVSCLTLYFSLLLVVYNSKRMWTDFGTSNVHQDALLLFCLTIAWIVFIKFIVQLLLLAVVTAFLAIRRRQTQARLIRQMRIL